MFDYLDAHNLPLYLSYTIESKCGRLVEHKSFCVSYLLGVQLWICNCRMT